MKRERDYDRDDDDDDACENARKSRMQHKDEVKSIASEDTENLGEDEDDEDDESDENDEKDNVNNTDSSPSIDLSHASSSSSSTLSDIVYLAELAAVRVIEQDDILNVKNEQEKVKTKGKEWSKEDVEYLMKARNVGEGKKPMTFSQIAKNLSKTEDQCRFKFKSEMRKGLNKTHWNEEEDDCIMDIMIKMIKQAKSNVNNYSEEKIKENKILDYEMVDFKEVVKRMKSKGFNRDEKQCKDHWIDVLDECNNKKELSEDEIEILLNVLKQKHTTKEKMYSDMQKETMVYDSNANRWLYRSSWVLRRAIERYDKLSESFKKKKFGYPWQLV